MWLGTQVPPGSGPGGRWGRRPSPGEGAQEQGALLPRQDIGTRRCPLRRPPCSPLGTSCSWPHWPVRRQNQASGSGIECSEGSAAPQVAVRVQGTRRERGSAGGIRTQPRPPLASAGRPPPGSRIPHSEGPNGSPGPTRSRGMGHAGPLDSRQLGRLVSVLQSGLSGRSETRADPVSPCAGAQLRGGGQEPRARPRLAPRAGRTGAPLRSTSRLGVLGLR